MLEACSEFAEKYRLMKAYRVSVRGVAAVWNWLSERAWPVYSTGVIVSALCMLASAQEKQILADHLYGADVEFQKSRELMVEEARKLFQEECSQGVKQVVWMQPRDEFMREYRERHENA